MNAERERWRKANWGYPPEFLEAEKELLGIAPEPQQTEPAMVEYLIKRLDKQQAEIADLRNRLNKTRVTVTKGVTHPIGGINL